MATFLYVLDFSPLTSASRSFFFFENIVVMGFENNGLPNLLARSNGNLHSLRLDKKQNCMHIVAL